MRRVRADGEIKLQDSLVVRPTGSNIRTVMAQLKPYPGKLTGVVLKTCGLAPGLAIVSLHARLFEGVGKNIERVIPSADAPAVYSIDPLDIEPILLALQRVDNAGRGVSQRFPIASEANIHSG